MITLESTKNSLSKVPQTAGVYMFQNKNAKTLYVGKAKNLKNRLSSYFHINLAPKTAQMINKTKAISFIEVGSELEALLLEAKLVKKLKPKYNSELKDDKSPLYIVITKEKYPRILGLRQTHLSKYNIKDSFGPFVNGGATRRVLKILRKIFPYSQHKLGKKPCIYSQIGLCNPCPSYIKCHPGLDPGSKTVLRRTYLKNIKYTKGVLNGRIKYVRRKLEKEMNNLSRKEDFEEAGVKSSQINMLDYITSSPVSNIDEYIKNPNLIQDIRAKELQELESLLGQFFNTASIKRIECFDVAHLSGTHPTASMVTFINGEPDKKYYRHFHVSKNKTNNDYDSIKQILQRRQKHFHDWGKPDLIIVDGGKPQVKAAIETFGSAIPIMGLAKRHEKIVVYTDEGYKEKLVPRGPALYLIQRLRNEAHRFARRLHHKHVKKSLLSQK